jgi:flagellar biosynthesis GTPase FlhF
MRGFFVRNARHSAAQRDTAQRSATQRSAARHSATQRSATQHSTAQHSAAQRNTAQHSAAQRDTAQRDTAQHSATQRSTAQKKFARIFAAIFVRLRGIDQALARQIKSGAIALNVQCNRSIKRAAAQRWRCQFCGVANKPLI